MLDHNITNLQGSLETFQLSFPLLVGFSSSSAAHLQEGVFQVLCEVKSIRCSDGLLTT